MVRARGEWSLHTFENRVNDLIAFDSSFLPANIETAVIRARKGPADRSACGMDGVAYSSRGSIPHRTPGSASGTSAQATLVAAELAINGRARASPRA